MTVEIRNVVVYLLLVVNMPQLDESVSAGCKEVAFVCRNWRDNHGVDPSSVVNLVRVSEENRKSLALFHLRFLHFY